MSTISEIDFIHAIDYLEEASKLHIKYLDKLSEDDQELIYIGYDHSVTLNQLKQYFNIVQYEVLNGEDLIDYYLGTVCYSDLIQVYRYINDFEDLRITSFSDAKSVYRALKEGINEFELLGKSVPRHVPHDIWTQPYFIALKPNEKIVWIYLLNTRQTDFTDDFKELDISEISEDTGISTLEIIEALLVLTKIKNELKY